MVSIGSSSIRFREIHFDSEVDDRRSPKHQPASNRRSPFRDASSNGKRILFIKFILLLNIK
jgi:hypothetical protein